MAQQAAVAVAQQAAAAHAAAAAVSAAVAAGANAASATPDKSLVPVSQASQPKRLHVSNIPFRFRDPDLRNMFGVRIPSYIFCLYTPRYLEARHDSDVSVLIIRVTTDYNFNLHLLYFSNMAQYLM